MAKQKIEPPFKVGELYSPGFDKLRPHEKIDNLDGLAHKVKENTSYTKRLTPEELANKKTELAEVSIELNEIAQEKKEAMAKFKAKAEGPELTKSTLLTTIKHRSERRTGMLFEIADQESGFMGVFDETGECVEVRPLDREERQLNLRSELRKAE